MQGVSREAYRASLQHFEQEVGSLPDGAGSAEVSEGLYAVAGLLDREPSLRRALTDPASSPDTRRGLVQNLLGRQLAPLPLKVLQDVVAQPWSTPTDLRVGVEQLAAEQALHEAAPGVRRGRGVGERASQRRLAVEQAGDGEQALAHLARAGAVRQAADPLVEARDRLLERCPRRALH